MLKFIDYDNNQFRLYNTGDNAYASSGLELWSSDDTDSGDGLVRCNNIGVGSLMANSQGGTLQNFGCQNSYDVGNVDCVYLIDADGDNDQSDDSSPAADWADKAWVIDAVCWNTGSGTDALATDNADRDHVIDSGTWAAGSYVDNDNQGGITLVEDGRNDRGAADWAAIPEFSTLLMPIASVMLIIGYNYRKKEKLES